MKSLRQQPTVLKEHSMTRPDLDTLACVNPECQGFRRTGQANLTVRKVYGTDRIRLLRCRTCGEECSERRGSALFNTKLPEARAADGDRLDMEAEGTFCFNTAVALYTFTVVGGTGRFAEASGSGSWLVPAPTTFDGVSGT